LNENIQIAPIHPYHKKNKTTISKYLKKINYNKCSRFQTINADIQKKLLKDYKLFFKAIVEMKICLIFAPH